MIGKFCLAALCLTAAFLFYGCAPTVTVNGETFEALTSREEKDLVLILARAHQRQGIMKAISAEIQNRTAEHGIAFSMPATDVVGLNPEAWLRDSGD